MDKIVENKKPEEMALEKLKAQYERLKNLQEASNSILSILGISELFPSICRQASVLFNANGCILWILEGTNLQIKAFYGLTEINVRPLANLRLGEGIAGWVTQTGKPLLIDDVARIPENLRAYIIEAKSMVCVPLKTGERIIGALGVFDKKNEHGVTYFTEEDIDPLNTFARTSSVAIENAKLYRTEVEKEKRILSLYWEVTQAKDYLESIIEYSADAIIISDMNGLITSWNKGAEKIYGYAEEEVLGKFLPMIPPSEIENEKSFIEKILKKEKLRNMETKRQTKDGRPIEVSLTLSPIIDSSGKVAGISGISRDISEKKRVEKELIRKNQELSRLFFINSVVRGTLDLDRLLRMVLAVVTMSDGLGFNRAILFLVDETQNILKGVMGIGPANAEEAGNIWLSLEGKNLFSIIRDIESGPLHKDSHLDKLSQSLSINLDEDSILCRCIREKTPFNILNAETEYSASPVLVQLGTKAFGVVPLITRDKAIGAILVDNLFTWRAITDGDLNFLMGFTSHIASAIENARLFEEVSLAQSELKNIFESISDMVYFNDKDFTIRNINQAVVNKIGKPPGEIIGKKCYEIFHGKDKPWDMCPHLKTINLKRAYVEEIEDSYLGGTFVVSSSPIFDSAGNLVGTVHISRDITELHALRERLAASERMAALGEMAARVAHEIRNPLISVGGFARRLGKTLEGDQHEYAEIIVEEVGRLESILKEILGFVKVAKLVMEKVNLNDVVENAINFITPEILERGNNLTKQLSASPIIITIDANRIKEAILNVLTNANQLTELGMITVKTWQKNTDAVIEISDTGCGIHQEDLKHIFTPFFTTRPSGTGLGLAITHKIIQEHNGRIEVESERAGPGETGESAAPNKKGGATFRIYLPLGET